MSKIYAEKCKDCKEYGNYQKCPECKLDAFLEEYSRRNKVTIKNKFDYISDDKITKESLSKVETISEFI
jgi:hypothetical protein